MTDDHGARAKSLARASFLERRMPFGNEAGGLGAFGVVIMPLMIAGMILKQPPGPVAKLLAAKATSPEAARRLDKIGIPRPYLVESAVRRGVVNRTRDGRYWVDVQRNRCFRRKVSMVAGGLALLLAAGVWGLIKTLLGGSGGVS